MGKIIISADRTILCVISFIFYGRDVSRAKQYSIWLVPIGIVMLSVTQITLYTIDMVKWNATEANGPIAKALKYDPHKKDEFWRYITYMFVHVGGTHLSINIILQILFGIWFAIVHGWWKVLIIHLAGVLTGSLMASLMAPSTDLAGASAGVFALFAAHIASIIMNWKNMRESCTMLAFFFFLTVFAIVLHYLNIKDNISNVAHVAGAVAGLLVGICITRKQQVNSYKKILCWVSFILYIVLMILAVFWNISCNEGKKKCFKVV